MTRVLATSFLYLLVHRRIVGDVHIYLRFALKMSHRFRKRRLPQISPNSVLPVCRSHPGKRRITQTTPRDRQGHLVFWRQESLVDDPPFPLNLHLKWLTPLRTSQFLPISAHSASTVRADKNVQLALIGSRPRAFQRSKNEPCTVYVTPKSAKGWHKTQFCLIFASKIQLLSKTSATKFLCVKTSSGRVVATSFLSLTVYRWIAGDVLHNYLKFALKLTHPIHKTPISIDFA